MATLLSELKSIRFVAADGRAWRKPRPQVVSNLPMMWQFLEMIQQDWRRGIEPAQANIDSAEETRRSALVGVAFLDLQPLFLKCLFSYTLFFRSLELAYEGIYADIDSIRRETELRVRQPKKPKPSAEIHKLREIRNRSIAHPGTTKGNHIDLVATASWQPMTLSKSLEEPWDLERLTFGGLRYRCHRPDGTTLESGDHEVAGLVDTHARCVDYLEQWDRVCAEYLSGLLDRMPHRVGEGRWEAF